MKHFKIPAKLSPEDIRKIRKDLGLSQTLFGEMLGVSLRTVQNWEKGTRNIKRKTIELLEKQLSSYKSSHIGDDIMQEPEEIYEVDPFETMILKYLDHPNVKKKIKEIANEEKDIENFTLRIGIGEENSGLIQRIEEMIRKDFPSHKLPKEIKNPENTGDDK